MSDRVLALVAHPDDETFGCGATLARHVLSGDSVSVVAFADGVASRGNSPAAIKERHSQFRAACKIIGTEDVWAHQYQDNRMDTLALLQVVQHIETHIERFKPSIVYTHWIGDLNVDHQVLHRATNVACRPKPGCTVKQLLYFEIPCSTAWGEGFAPNYFVDVSSTMQIKLEACASYKSEVMEWPHPRSISGISVLANRRGSVVGVSAAEAFMAGRIVA